MQNESKKPKKKKKSIADKIVVNNFSKNLHTMWKIMNGSTVRNFSECNSENQGVL